MIGPEIIEAYLANRQRWQDVERELKAINVDLKPLADRHRELVTEMNQLEKQGKKLKSDYQVETGLDLKKQLRSPAVELIDRAIGALKAALRGLDGLAPHDPAVIRRVQQLQEALAIRDEELATEGKLPT